VTACVAVAMTKPQSMEVAMKRAAYLMMWFVSMTMRWMMQQVLFLPQAMLTKEFSPRDAAAAAAVVVEQYSMATNSYTRGKKYGC